MFGGTYGGGYGGGAMDPFGGLGGGFARFGRRFGAVPSAYDEYLTAYSMAMLPGQERDNVSYGGKIILPPMTLAKITELEIESPWIFKLRNPNTDVPPRDTLPKQEGEDASEGSSSGTTRYRGRESHAGVLEFIAEPGRCHLPAWMMNSLGLQEGDQIRVIGTTLPKGKLVKIQPQSVDFLEISDPKAVLEQALRNFSTLTPGDIIEFKYNCLTFEVLIMEIKPDAAGITIVDTDLEVDFAAPKGYIEPEVKPRPPPPTMASKLNIETSKTDSIPASGSSTPLGGGDARRDSSNSLAAPAGPFRGSGHTLSGKKSKGKKDKAIEKIDPFSLVRRTDVPRIVTNDTQMEEKKIPAALNLDFGKLFFGYEFIPPGGKQENKENTSAKQISFSGTGQTLSGRAPRRRVEESTPAVASTSANTSANTEASAEGSGSGGPAPFSGQGQTLGSRGATKRSGGQVGHGRSSNRQRSEENMDTDG